MVPPPKAEIIIEFRRVGTVVKVTAVDPVSNTEVSIIGPARASRAALQQAAVQKLRYVLAKNRTGGD
jgi:hypothetical protein